jgi:hypothetical protein
VYFPLGVKKAHDWMVDQVDDFFYTTDKVKTHQVVKREVIIVETSSWWDI